MAPAELRHHLIEQFAYFRLVLGLEPGQVGHKDPAIQALIAATKEFIHEGTDDDIAQRGSDALAVLQKMCEAHRTRLTPKYEDRPIGEDFLRLEAEEADVWKAGVRYGWLAERFVTPAIVLPYELPMHARVGIGRHAGRVALEEADLLHDAFFMLVLARGSMAELRTFGERNVEPGSVEESRQWQQSLTPLSLNVGTFARLAVVTSVAFVESFVNGIGHGEAGRSSLSVADGEFLRGRKDGRFISLEAKLERFPALIRSDGHSPLRVSDPSQRREPFKTFLALAKSVRDAAMHFGPGKVEIIRTPLDWGTVAETAVLGGIAVAREVWMACYDDRTSPKYLMGLDAEKLIVVAEQRLSARSIE